MKKITRSLWFTALCYSIIILCFTASSAEKCGKSKTEVYNNAFKVFVDSYTQTITTTSGVTVAYKDRVPLAEEQQAIDEAFVWADIKAQENNLNGGDSGRGLWKVILVKSDRDYTSEGAFVPIINVPISCKPPIKDYYCDSEYDKGVYRVDGRIVEEWIHHVWAAELVIPQSVVSNFNTWVVAYSPNVNNELSRITMTRATVYGWEHTALFRWDYERFFVTAGHLTGGHPILPIRATGEFNSELTEKIAKASVEKFVSTLENINKHPPYECAKDGQKRAMCVVK